jgi:hypothetical protein
MPSHVLEPQHLVYRGRGGTRRASESMKSRFMAASVLASDTSLCGFSRRRSVLSANALPTPSLGFFLRTANDHSLAVFC